MPSLGPSPILHVKPIARAWPLLALLFWTLSSHAAQVQRLEVQRAGGHLLIEMRVRIEAPPPAVFQALQNYAALARFEPEVRSLRVEPLADRHRVRLRMTLYGCLLFFCKTLHQVQIMTATAAVDGGVVDSEIVPLESDFRAGHARWTVHPCPAMPRASCMKVRMDLVPAFWIPPWIGPWLIERKLYRAVVRGSVGLERMAQAR